MQDNRYTQQDMNEGFVVAIHITAKTNEGDAMEAILDRLVAPTMAEPGVKLFLPYRSPENPLDFFIFELYEDENAWDEHQQTEHFQREIKELLPRAESRQRIPFVPFASLKSSLQ